VEGEADGDRQQQELGADETRDRIGEGEPAAVLRNLPVGEPETGEDLRGERRQAEPFVGRFEVEQPGGRALAQDAGGGS
jgi:hypothetical protein